MMQSQGTIPAEKSARTKAREGHFLDFAKAIRANFPALPLLADRRLPDSPRNAQRR